MKKNKILFISIILFFISINVMHAQTCVDSVLITTLADVKKSEYEALDKELALEIKKITTQMNKAHNEIEAKSLTTMINIEELKKKYLILEKEILFNQENINELNSILVDTIGENANLKTGKKSLESIKRELILK